MISGPGAGQGWEQFFKVPDDTENEWLDYTIVVEVTYGGDSWQTTEKILELTQKQIETYFELDVISATLKSLKHFYEKRVQSSKMCTANADIS